MKVKITDISGFLEPEIIKDINCIVTEERVRDDSQYDEEEDVYDIKSGFPEIDFAHEDDFYAILEEGSLESLLLNVEYEFGEKADVIKLASYVIEYIAKRQIFGNGNKRTSFVVGYLIIFISQVLEDFDEIRVPALTDDFVDLIGNVAISDNPEDREDVEEFLSVLDDHLSDDS